LSVICATPLFTLRDASTFEMSCRSQDAIRDRFGAPPQYPTVFAIAAS